MKTLLKASLLLAASIGSAAGAEVPSYGSVYGGGVATRPLTVPYGGSIYAPSYSSPSYNSPSYSSPTDAIEDARQRDREAFIDQQIEKSKDRDRGESCCAGAIDRALSLD